MSGVWGEDVAGAIKRALDAAPSVASAGARGVWDTEVMPGAPYPFVRVQMIDATDTHTFGARVFTMYRVQVEAVAINDKNTAKLIMDAVDTVLERGVLEYDTGTHQIISRLGIIPTISGRTNDGRAYWKVGATYEVGVAA